MAPREPPDRARRAPRRAPEPGTIVLALRGRITRAAIPALCERLRMLLRNSDADQVICDVEALTDPDLDAVDVLARLQLTAHRLGREVRLDRACAELEDLLDLAGLAEALPRSEPLDLEPRRKPEQREPPSGVEEEGDPGDPVA